MPNWTQADLDAFYKSRGEAVPKPAAKPLVRVELGEWVTESFFIAGAIPSKKNRKRAIIKQGPDGPVPGLITDGEVQKQLAALTNQCAMHWGRLHRWPLTNATLSIHFAVSHVRQDFDNAQNSLFDSLVKGGVLRDDSMKHLIRLKDIDFELVERGSEGAWVTVRGQEYIETVVKAA